MHTSRRILAVLIGCTGSLNAPGLRKSKHEAVIERVRVTTQDVDDATVLRGGLIGARRRALKLTTAVVETSKISSGATTVVAHHEDGDGRPQDRQGRVTVTVLLRRYPAWLMPSSGSIPLPTSGNAARLGSARSVLPTEIAYASTSNTVKKNI